jgi:hypothetical protein
MLIVAVVTQFVNGYIRPLSIALQAIACDLVGAHIQARLLVAKCQERFHTTYQILTDFQLVGSTLIS